VVLLLRRSVCIDELCWKRDVLRLDGLLIEGVTQTITRSSSYEIPETLMS
jgi:hypothetical protein